MFSYTLKKLRQSRGLSQEQLAEALGTSRQTVSKWESGSALPDALNLLSISDYFGVSTDALLRGLREEETNPLSSVTPDSPETSPIADEIPSDGGAPADPAPQHTFRLPGRGRLEFEYISKKRVFGMPLVHIHVGLGFYRAKGVFALGMLSKGLVSMGLLSMGLLSFGLLSLGLLAFGGFSLGLAAFGGVAIGALAVAGIAAGLFAIGGISLGVIAVGGVAIASHIAVGGLAIAPVSLDVAKGVTYILTETGTVTLTAAEVEAHILAQFPNFPQWLLDLILRFFESFE